MSTDATYQLLIDLLDDAGVPYRLIEHAAEGRTEQASELRGHPLAQAAKCIVVGVRMSGHHARHVLAVVPGASKVDLHTVRDLAGGTAASLAPAATAVELTGCEIGSIVPFRLLPTDMDVYADPWLIEQPTLYFNAARLDRSVAISTADYLEVAAPHLEPVAAAA